MARGDEFLNLDGFSHAVHWTHPSWPPPQRLYVAVIGDCVAVTDAAAVDRRPAGAELYERESYSQLRDDQVPENIARGASYRLVRSQDEGLEGT